MTAPTPPQTFVACVRLYYDAPDPQHPIARVRYGRGTTFTGWTDTAHDGLAALTGQGEPYWQQIHSHAITIATGIRHMITIGAIGRITAFSGLHDYFDANTGWSEEIDALDVGRWTHVEFLVTDMLRTPNRWDGPQR